MAGGILDDILPSTSNATVLSRASDMVPKPLTYGIPNYDELRTKRFNLWGRNTKISSAEGLRQILGSRIFNEIKDHPLWEHIQGKLEEFQNHFSLHKLATELLTRIPEDYEPEPLATEQIGELLQFFGDTTIPHWAYTRGEGENAVTSELQSAITVAKVWNETIMKNSYDTFAFDAMSKYVEKYERRPGKKKTNLDVTYDMGTNITRDVVLKALSRCLGSFFIRCTLYAFRAFTAIQNDDGKVCNYTLDMNRIKKFASAQPCLISPSLPSHNGALSPSSISSGRSTSSGEGSFRSPDPRLRFPEKPPPNTLKEEFPLAPVARTVSVDAVVLPVCQPGAVVKSASVDTPFSGEMSPPIDAPPSRFDRRKPNNQPPGSTLSSYYSSPPPKKLPPPSGPFNGHASRVLFPGHDVLQPGLTVSRGIIRSSTSTDEEPPPKRNPEDCIFPLTLDSVLHENNRLRLIIDNGVKENSRLRAALQGQDLEMVEGLKEENAALKDRNATLYDEKLDMEDDIKKLEDKMRLVEMARDKAQAEMKDTGGRIKAMVEGMAKTEARHKEQVKRLEEELKIAAERIKDLEQKEKLFEDLENKCNELQKELVQKKADIGELEKKIVALGNNEAYLQNSYQEVPKTVETQAERILKLEADVNDLETKLDEAENKIRQLEQTAEENENREKQVEIQIKSSIKTTDSDQKFVDKSIYDQLFIKKEELRRSLLERDRMAIAREAELNEEIAAVKRRINKELEDVKAQADTEINRHTSTVRQITAQLTNCKKSAADKLATIERLQRELDVEKSKSGEMPSKLDKAMADLSNITEERDQLLVTKEEARQAADRMQQELAEVRADLGKINTSYELLQKMSTEQSTKIVCVQNSLDEAKRELECKPSGLIAEYEKKLQEIQRNKNEELEKARADLEKMTKERNSEAVARASLFKQFEAFKKEKTTQVNEQLTRIQASRGLAETSQPVKEEPIKKHQEEMAETMKKFEEFKDIAVKTQDELRAKNEALIQNNDILAERIAQLEATMELKREVVERRDEELLLERKLEEDQRKSELDQLLKEAVLKKEDELTQATARLEEELAAEKQKSVEEQLEKTRLAKEIEKLKKDLEFKHQLLENMRENVLLAISK